MVLATTWPVSAEDWTTADGKTYKNVVVVAQEDDGVRITYDGGVGKIPYYELPLDLQKRFGEDYDSLEAKRKAAEKALEDATRNADAAAAATAAAAQKKAQDEAAAAQANAQSGSQSTPSSASSQSSPQQAINSQPASPPGASSSTPASPVAVAAQAEAKALYPGSKFSYDEVQDICYLDSPAVNVMLVVPEATPLAASPAGTLSLRIVTDGHTPQTPDRIEATFIPFGIVKVSADAHNVKFLVDGTYVPVTDLVTDDSGQVGNTIAFYLDPEQAQAIFQAKNVNFSVGSINYMIDQAGMTTFRKFFDDVGHLPPASSNFIRTYHKFLNRLPSIITVISTVCAYIILGSFAILVAASVAAFIMGVTRFIKM